MRTKPILIVDDHCDTVDMPAEILRDAFPYHPVSVGRDGAHALRLAKLRRPRVVVIDVDTPNTGGTEAAAEMRSQLPSPPQLTLIAMTGGATILDTGQLPQLFDHCLTKPVDIDLLIERRFRHGHSYAAVGPPGLHTPARSWRRTIFGMSGVQLLRRAAKFLHEVASIGFGGGLAVCLLINLTAKSGLPNEFIAARHVYASIAQHIVIPSMVIVVISGLIALAAIFHWPPTLT